LNSPPPAGLCHVSGETCMAGSIYLKDVINIMHLELEEILCDLWMVYAVLQAKNMI
jgi:hypothetical protein